MTSVTASQVSDQGAQTAMGNILQGTGGAQHHLIRALLNNNTKRTPTTAEPLEIKGRNGSPNQQLLKPEP